MQFLSILDKKFPKISAGMYQKTSDFSRSPPRRSRLSPIVEYEPRGESFCADHCLSEVFVIIYCRLISVRHTIGSSYSLHTVEDRVYSACSICRTLSPAETIVDAPCLFITRLVPKSSQTSISPPIRGILTTMLHRRRSVLTCVHSRNCCVC